MKKLTSTLAAGLYSLVMFLGVAVVMPEFASAHEGEDHSTTAEAEKHEAETEQKKQTTVTYNYVAQTGDSYTQMARKAIQTYGIKNKSKLSRAKIIAAETWLTQAAQSPFLDVNQKVQIKESTVKDYVTKALALSADQEAAWATYVSGVNFNTNAVGQAR